MLPNLFEISPSTLNLFSFILGMTFASFLSWYRRTAFVYIVGYFMALAFYYGTIKPNLNTTPVQTPKNTSSTLPKSEYSSPLPMPSPRGYK
jgi:hypothetical protein